jgi:hypothetical protein
VPLIKILGPSDVTVHCPISFADCHATNSNLMFKTAVQFVNVINDARKLAENRQLTIY